MFRSVLLLLCSGLAAIAQPAALSVDDAIRLAWSRDPALEPLRRGAELAAAREVQAARRPRPELELTGSTPLASGGEWGLGVAVSRQLVRPETAAAARALAQLGGEAVEPALRERLVHLAGEVRALYYDALVQIARRDAAARNLAAHREFLATLERRHAAGEVPDADRESLRLEALRADHAAGLAAAEADAALDRLRHRLRLPDADAVALDGRLDDLLARPLPEAPALLALRPEVALAEHAVREAAAALGLAEAETRAAWKIGAGLEFANRANDATGRRENEPQLRVGASLPWGGRTDNRGDVLERQAALRQAEARRDAVRGELAAEAGAALAAVRRLQPAVLEFRAAVAARAPLPPALRAAYDRGEIPGQQLAQLRQQHLALEQDYLAAAARYAAALATAESLLGLIPANP